MAYNSLDVANAFLEKAKKDGRALTNMQIQKLVFLAQGYALALLGEPITYHNAHAWQWGPVFPQIYKRFGHYGAAPISEPLPTDSKGIDEDSKESSVIAGVWQVFGNYTGPQLSSLSHQQEGPWDQTWKQEKYGVIPTELIAEYFSKQIDAKAAALSY